MKTIHDIAQKYSISLDAVSVLQAALAKGGGSMAQFNHPELGGMGQWQRGGMIMIGDMFNNTLKAKIDGLCVELSSMATDIETGAADYKRAFGENFASVPNAAQHRAWWEGITATRLGTMTASGSQNGMEYAYFHSAKRLATRADGVVTLYDTSNHTISGFSQEQQSPGSSQILVLQTAAGNITLADLKKVS